MAEINTRRRRYYRLKARAARELGDRGLAFTWHAKLQALDGIPLAALTDFPRVAELAAAPIPYTTLQDLDGADAEELTHYTGLNRHAAENVLAAAETELAKWADGAQLTLDFSELASSQYLTLL